MGLYILVTSVILLVCVLLVLVVLVQNSKGGGLAPNFSGAGSVMGVRQASNVVEKTTWTLAAVLGVLCLLAVAVIPRSAGVQTESRIQDQLNRTLNANPGEALPVIPGQEEAQPAENLEDILVDPAAQPAPAPEAPAE